MVWQQSIMSVKLSGLRTEMLWMDGEAPMANGNGPGWTGGNQVVHDCTIF
jgi:hypothetical protein